MVGKSKTHHKQIPPPYSSASRSSSVTSLPSPTAAASAHRSENEVNALKETKERVTEILSTVFSQSVIPKNSDRNDYENGVSSKNIFHQEEHKVLVSNFTERKEKIFVLFSKNDAKNFFLQELDENRSRNGLLTGKGFVIMTMIMEVCICVCMCVCICICVCVCVCVCTCVYVCE